MLNIFVRKPGIMHRSEAGLLSIAAGTAVDWWEYQLVVEPEGLVGEQIGEEQRAYFGKGYEERPHILLARFHAKEMMEETLVRWIQKICVLQGGFHITLNNYGAQPPHDVYIRIQDQEPLRKLVHQLRILESLLYSEVCPAPEWIGSFHLHVATCTTEAAYLDALHFYARRSFHGVIAVNRLVLYKKNYPGDLFKMTYTFPLPRN
jgi:hypothetical protein